MASAFALRIATWLCKPQATPYKYALGQKGLRSTYHRGSHLDHPAKMLTMLISLVPLGKLRMPVLQVS